MAEVGYWVAEMGTLWDKLSKISTLQIKYTVNQDFYFHFLGKATKKSSYDSKKSLKSYF